MPNDDKDKTIEDIPEAQRADVQALIDSGVATAKAEVQTEFDDFKKVHNTNLGTLQTKYDGLEDEIAGLKDGSKNPPPAGELGIRQQAIVDRRADEKEAADRKAVLDGKDETIGTLNKVLLRQLGNEARELNIPDELIKAATTVDSLEAEISRSKLYGNLIGNGTEKKVAASPAGIMKTDGQPADQKTDVEVATGLVGDAFK